MLDLTGLLDGTQGVTVFASPHSTNQWSTWVKPLGCKLVHILCIGAGAGGGGGHTAAAGVARGGGGGGGSGATTFTTVPALLMPDILYVQVGAGGAGGAATVDGSAGSISIVAIAPDSTLINLFVTSGSAGAVGGGRGTVSQGGAGGTQGAVISSNVPFLHLGNYVNRQGSPGGAGGAHTGAVGSNVNAFNAQITSPGSGGAGTGTTNVNFAGGTVFGTNDLAPAVAGGTAAGGAGNPGYQIQKPLCFIGGSGGGSNGASGVGGGGGSGSIGSGGGGGAGGVTGGAGGPGGDGMIVFSCS